MAELFGIAASAAGLLGVTVQLSELTYKYVGSVHEAQDAVASYIQELATLTSAVLRLKNASNVQSVRHLLAGDRDEGAIIKALEDCKREVGQLRDKLEKRSATDGVRGKLASLTWPFSESEVKKKVQMLQRYNTIFSSVLVADNLTMAIANYHESRDLRNENMKKDWIAWFQPRIEVQSAESYLERLCPGTGTSITSHESYLAWRDGSRGVLWAYGQPGAGKTMFSSLAVQDINMNVSGDKIVHACALPNTWDEVSRVWTKCNQSNTEPLSKDLVDILIAASKLPYGIFIILDGLDECPCSDSLVRNLQTLNKPAIKLLVGSRDFVNLTKHLESCLRLEITAGKEDLYQYVVHQLQNGIVDTESIDATLLADISSAIHRKAAGSFLLAQLAMDDIKGLLTVKSIRKRLSSLPSNAQEAYKNTYKRIMNQQSGLKVLALQTLSWVQNVQRPLRMTELQRALATYDGMSDLGPGDLPSAKIILSSCQGFVVLSEVDDTVGIVHSTATRFLRKKPDGLDKTPDLTIARACLSYLSVNELAKGPCATLDELEQRLKRLPFLDYGARFFGHHVRRCEEQCINELCVFLQEDNLRHSAWQVLNFTVGFGSPFAQQIFRSNPSRASALHCAAFWGFAKYLAMALEKGDSPVKRPCPGDQRRNLNGVDSHGWTPLHWAVSMGHTGTTRLLLDSGAFMNEPDTAGWTPIFWAAFKGHLDLVRLLKSRNAATSVFDTNGLTPLNWAMCAGHDKVAKILLSADGVHVTPGPGGGTPLYELNQGTWARGGLELRELSVLKAKQLSANNTGTRPLTFSDLYTEGADTSAFSAVIHNLGARYLDTCLARPVSCDPFQQDALVYNILSRNMKPHFFRKRDRFRRTKIARGRFVVAMMANALRLDNLPTVKLLLDLNIFTVEMLETHKMLCSAARHESRAVAEFIDRGANVNQKDSQDRSPLHIACQLRDEETVMTILGSPAVDVDARDSEQYTPLMLLLQRRQYNEEEQSEIQRLAKLFISKGDSASARNRKGESVMHFAVRAWIPEVIKLLLDSGADMNARDLQNRTPLSFLATAGSALIPGPDAIVTVDLALRWSDLDNLNSIQDFVDPLDNKPLQKHTLLSIALQYGNWALASRLIDLRAIIPTDATLRAHMHRGVSALCNLSAVAPGAQPPPTGRLDTLDDGPPWGQSVVLEFKTWLSLFRFLIGAGVNVNERAHPQDQKDTLLHLCIRRRFNVSVIEALLQAGANPFLKCEDHFDCFQLALLYRRDVDQCCNTTAILKCLRTWAQTMRPPDSSHWFHEEEVAGYPPLSEEDRYLELLRCHDAIDVRGKSGGTLLVHASRRRNMWLSRRLIAYGADVCTTDRYGWSALHSAAWYQDLEMVTLLVQAGANVGQRGDQPVNGRRSWIHGWSATPLQLCVKSPASNWPKSRGSEANAAEEIVRTLLRSGSDPNDKVVASQRGGSWDDEKTPLEILFAALPEAASRDHTDQLISVIRVLCDNKADIAAAARNMTIAAVAKLEGHESLWDFIRSQLPEEQKEEEQKEEAWSTEGEDANAPAIYRLWRKWMGVF